MPTNVVKTPEQEELWNKAKQIAANEGHKEDYAYIMGIYKRMGGLTKSATCLLIDGMMEKEADDAAGYISRSKGKLYYDSPGDDGIGYQIWDHSDYDDPFNMTRDEEYDLEDRTNDALGYGQSILDQHPDHQKVLDEMDYNDERRGLRSKFSRPVGNALLVGTPAAAIVGVGAINKKLGIPLRSNMGKTLIGGLIGGGIVGGVAGNRIDEHYRKKMGYPEYKYDVQNEVEDDINRQVGEKYLSDKKASDIINELFEKTALTDEQIQQYQDRNFRDDRISIEDLVNQTREKYGDEGVTALARALKNQHDLYDEVGFKGVMSPEELNSFSDEFEAMTPAERKAAKDKFDSGFIASQNPGFAGGVVLQPRSSYNKWNYDSEADLNNLYDNVDYSITGLARTPSPGSPKYNQVTNAAKKYFVDKNTQTLDKLPEGKQEAMLLGFGGKEPVHITKERLNRIQMADETEHPIGHINTGIGTGAGAIVGGGLTRLSRQSIGATLLGAGAGAIVGGGIGRLKDMANKIDLDYTTPVDKKASDIISDLFEKLAAADDIGYHASPVQGITKFRFGEDTSGNNKGKVIFTSKDTSFCSAFGVRWNDTNARLVVETTNQKPPTNSNYKRTVLKITDDIDLDKPCSMYTLKGKFKPLRYEDDIEEYTNDPVEVISEEKFSSFKEMAKHYGLEIKDVKESTIMRGLKGHKTSNFEKGAKELIDELYKEAGIVGNLMGTNITKAELEAKRAASALRQSKTDLAGKTKQGFFGRTKPMYNTKQIDELTANEQRAANVANDNIRRQVGKTFNTRLGAGAVGGGALAYHMKQKKPIETPEVDPNYDPNYQPDNYMYMSASEVVDDLFEKTAGKLNFSAADGRLGRLGEIATFAAARKAHAGIGHAIGSKTIVQMEKRPGYAENRNFLNKLKSNVEAGVATQREIDALKATIKKISNPDIGVAADSAIVQKLGPAVFLKNRDLKARVGQIRDESFETSKDLGKTLRNEEANLKWVNQHVDPDMKALKNYRDNEIAKGLALYGGVGLAGKGVYDLTHRQNHQEEALSN